MFHGNAGNIGHRVPIAEALAYSLACNVFMVEYRGYGASTGVPDERGLKIDAQTALEYVLGREDLAGTRVVIHGQSLGGAVGAWLAVKNQERTRRRGVEEKREGGEPIPQSEKVERGPNRVAGVILENTFLSLRKMVPSFLPAGKYFAWLCHQVWGTESIIGDLELPVLFLSGSKDEIVPPQHMAELFRLCGSDTKVFRSFPRGTHNETVTQPGYIDHVCDFLEAHVA
ncbi:hypothetical protein KEM52_003011 [Ascosphaera acerosa]|nr:hypothetical protein KEM52_003011 [Ascosphaera acerosa]